MNYVDNVYGNLLGNIGNEIQNHQLWVGVDETTDTRKRYVANVVIGDFSTEKVYLLNTEFLDQSNHSPIATSSMNSLQILWQEGILYSNVLCLISDAAAYMRRSYRDILAPMFPKSVHVTCVAHMIHNVAETARS